MSKLPKGMIYLLWFFCGVTAFPQGSNITIRCSLPGGLPAWTKDDKIIAEAGSRDISPAFPRISYATDNNTLELSNLSPQDEGDYICSLPATDPETITVTVDVALTLTSVNFPPGNEDGSGSVLTGCFTENDISVEWRYKKISDGSFRTVKSETMINTTGCTAGKAQQGARFFHTECRDSDKFEVRYCYLVMHASATETSISADTYNLCGCCKHDINTSYAMILLELIFSIIVVILLYVNPFNIDKKYRVCGCIAVAVTALIALIWFIAMSTTVDQPVEPDDKNNCDCASFLAYDIVVGIFAGVKLVPIIVTIYVFLRNKNG